MTKARRPKVKQPMLDRMADWLGRRSRLMRVFMAALVATAISVAIGILLYTLLDNVQVTTTGLIVTLVILALIGLGLYWVGWRVLVGFDFEDAPLQPGPAAVVWVLLGLIVLVAEVLIALMLLVQSVSA